MAAPADSQRLRILVVDDDPLVQRALVRTLTRGGARLSVARTDIGEAPADTIYKIEAVSQGSDAYELIYEANRIDQPVALAFVDIRMPPGWDGIETTERIWQVDPDVQVVICTAYTDYSWADIVGRLGHKDNLLVLKKPFDNVEVLQLAHALTQKWKSMREARVKMSQLEAMAQERTYELQVANESLRREAEERIQLEVELRHAQKLEAVGQLASGIAHELNTPAQFIGDNVRFLEEAYTDLYELRLKYEELVGLAKEGADQRQKLTELEEWKRRINIEFLEDQIPQAFGGALEGVERVSRIVRGMRTFARRDGVERHAADINSAIRTALDVCRSEYRYVATVHTELGDIRLVRCNIGDISQVFLNLIVNAAHAIEDKERAAQERGKIVIRTEQHDDFVDISFQDDGSGIPESIQDRIFEPFFTTKEVGRGTGQGLAIAHSIVVKQHGGSLTFESEEGGGTTFTIRLPI